MATTSRTIRAWCATRLRARSPTSSCRVSDLRSATRPLSWSPSWWEATLWWKQPSKLPISNVLKWYVSQSIVCTTDTVVHSRECVFWCATRLYLDSNRHSLLQQQEGVSHSRPEEQAGHVEQGQVYHRAAGSYKTAGTVESCSHESEFALVSSTDRFDS